MMPILLAFLLAPDAWVGPTDSAGPGSPTTETKHACQWQNSTGHDVMYGGPGGYAYPTNDPNHFHVTWPLTRYVDDFGHNYQGWDAPTGWTAFFADLGDFSVTRTVTAPSDHGTNVPDGSIYFHDIKVVTTTTYEQFTGGSANPGASAVRKRFWQTSDKSSDTEYYQSNPGGPAAD